jgi:hypothetical protein
MAFYQVVLSADYMGNLVQNTLWYRSSEPVGATTGEMNEAIDHVLGIVVPPWRAFVTLGWSLTRLTCYAYDDSTWERQPFLPQERDVLLAGTRPGPPPPPMYTATIGFAVEPQLVDPSTGRPVRRGYLAISGVPEGAFEPDGSILASFRTDALANAFTAALVAGYTEADASTLVNPVRVSKPGVAAPLRGWGLVLGALVRREASARRSRKLGKGA